MPSATTRTCTLSISYRAAVAEHPRLLVDVESHVMKFCARERPGANKRRKHYLSNPSGSHSW